MTPIYLTQMDKPLVLKLYYLLVATQMNSPASPWSGRLMLEEAVIYCHFIYRVWKRKPVDYD